ncbi:MAG: TraR/DksA C4-type zinc finger protein [Pseudonocardia sp.]|nr:TraR/DksA C4-type zinc finger protein [Pseudonocardia sp.]
MQPPDPAARLAIERTETAERAAALEAQVAALAEQQALTTHDDEHDPEGVTIGFQRALLQGLLAGARRDLDAVDRATQRLGDGTYGGCVRCGKPIPAERLDALPATETCLACGSRR